MNITDVIHKHGFTVKAVAQRMGIRHTSMSTMIWRDTMQVNWLRRIAAVIGADMVEFFADEKPVNGDGADVHLTALIECNGHFYKAENLKSLNDAVAEIRAATKKESNNKGAAVR